MVTLALVYLWEEAPEYVKQFAMGVQEDTRSILWEKVATKTDEKKKPAAILVFDYCTNLDWLRAEYVSQNPHVKRTMIRRVKFLPSEVFRLISKETLDKLFAHTMLTVVLAW